MSKGFKQTLLCLTLSMFLSPCLANNEAPSPWQFFGTHRIRYEYLNNQFREGLSGNDEALSLRTLLRARYQKNHLQLTAEVQDSRAYLNQDEDNVTATSIVNAWELLQANVQYSLYDVFNDNDQLNLLAGRFTKDLGSRRLVARNRFRNTIQNYTGLWFEWLNENAVHINAFYTLPVLIQPNDIDALIENEVAFDDADFDLRLWGVHAAWPTSWWDTKAEVYLLGLQEDDDQERQTANRQLYTPGVRWYRSPQVGRWDFELEQILQFGQRRLTRDVEDKEDLNVFAHFHHVRVGYTFDATWLPHAALVYDFASGNTLEAGEYHRFDTLLGPRRGEFGPTGIYGLLSRNNISSVGVRFSIQPNERLDAQVFWRASYADEVVDDFARTGLRLDPNDSSMASTSHFAGHQIDTRLRYWLWPKHWRWEGGLTWFARGELLRTTQDSQRRSENQGDPFYVYTSLEWFF